MCMRGPADAVLVLPSHTGARQREFEAVVHEQQLLQARHPRARPGGADAGTPAPRAADGEERPPSTGAVESREGSGRVQATARAAEGEGQAGRGEGSAASGATGDDMRETAAAWLRSRKVADALSEDPLQGVVVQWVDAADADGYPGAPTNGPARIWKGTAP